MARACSTLVMCEVTKLSRRAGRRAPFGSVRFLLEMCAGEKLLLKVLGIVHDGANDQQCFAVRFRDLVDILGQHGIRTVGNSVLAQIARLHASRYQMELTWPNGLWSFGSLGAARESNASPWEAEHAAAS